MNEELCHLNVYLKNIMRQLKLSVAKSKVYGRATTGRQSVYLFVDTGVEPRFPFPSNSCYCIPLFVKRSHSGYGYIVYDNIHTHIPEI